MNLFTDLIGRKNSYLWTCYTWLETKCNRYGVGLFRVSWALIILYQKEMVAIKTNAFSKTIVCLSETYLLNLLKYQNIALAWPTYNCWHMLWKGKIRVKYHVEIFDLVTKYVYRKDILKFYWDVNDANEYELCFICIQLLTVVVLQFLYSI